MDNGNDTSAHEAGGTSAQTPQVFLTERGKRMRAHIAQPFQTHIDFHLLIQAVVHNQAVSHSNPVRFHGMPRNIGIVAHVRIVEVRNGLLVAASWCRELHIHGGK